MVIAASAVVLLGFFYYQYYTPPLERFAKPPPVTSPLPELKDLRFVQGEIVQIIGKTMTVRVKKLVGQDFASSQAVSEEYQVVIGDKTELVKLALHAEGQKPVKAVLKDFKKGDGVAVYADKNLVEIKEFTATKVELLPK